MSDEPIPPQEPTPQEQPLPQPSAEPMPSFEVAPQPAPQPEAPREQQAPPQQVHGGVDWSQAPTAQQGQNYYPQSGQYQQYDGMQTLIPTKNSAALAAYYCAVFALIPCATIFLAPTAIFLGVKGLKAINENPGLPGKAHAWVGIIGGAGLLLLGLLIVAIAMVANAAS